MSFLVGYQVNGSSPSSVGGTGTTVKYFPNLLGPSIGVGPLTPSATSAVGQLVIPNINTANGQHIHVDAVGYINTTAGISCPNVTIALYAQTSAVLTSPTYTTLATTGAVAAGSFLNEPWALSVDLWGDTDSGIVYGQQNAFYNGLIKSSVYGALTNNL